MEIRIKTARSPRFRFNDSEVEPENGRKALKSKSSKKRSLKGPLLTVLAIFLSVALLMMIGAFVSLALFLYTGTQEVVEISNISTNSATVVWISELEEPGMAIALEGTPPSFKISSGQEIIAYDDRDIAAAEITAAQDMKERAVKEEKDGTVGNVVSEVKIKDFGWYKVHHVTFRNLKPDTNYNVMVGNGYLFKPVENNSFNTKPESAYFDLPAPAYGIVAESPEGSVISDGVMKVVIANPEGKVLTQPLTAALGTNGSWYIDLNAFYTLNGERFLDTVTEYEFTTLLEIHEVITSTGTYQQQLSTLNDAPSPDFVVSKAESVKGISDMKGSLFNKIVFQSHAVLEEGSGSGGGVQDPPKEEKDPYDGQDEYWDNEGYNNVGDPPPEPDPPEDDNKPPNTPPPQENQTPNPDHPHYNFPEGSVCASGTCGAVNFECLVNNTQSDDCWRLCVNGYWAMPEGCYGSSGGSNTGNNVGVDTDPNTTETPPEPDPYVCCWDEEKSNYVGDTSDPAGENCITPHQSIGTAKTRQECYQLFKLPDSDILDRVEDTKSAPPNNGGQDFGACCKSKSGVTTFKGIGSKKESCPDGDLFLWFSKEVTCNEASTPGDFGVCCQKANNMADEYWARNVSCNYANGYHPVSSKGPDECGKISAAVDQFCCKYDYATASYVWWVGKDRKKVCTDKKEGSIDPASSSGECVGKNEEGYDPPNTPLPNPTPPDTKDNSYCCSYTSDQRTGKKKYLWYTDIAESVCTSFPDGTVTGIRNKEQCEERNFSVGPDRTPQQNNDNGNTPNNWDDFVIPDELRGLPADPVEPASPASPNANGPTCEQYKPVGANYCKESTCVDKCGSKSCEEDYAQVPLEEGLGVQFVPYWACRDDLAPSNQDQHYKTMGGCKSQCVGNRNFSGSCVYDDKKWPVEYIPASEESSDERCKDTDNYACLPVSGDKVYILSLGARCTYVPKSSSNLREEQDEGLFTNVKNRLIRSVSAQDNGGPVVIYSPEDNGYLAEEDGKYIFIYKGQIYEVMFTQGEGAVYMVYIDKNDNRRFDPEVETALDIDPVVLKMSKVSEAFGYELSPGYNFISFDFIPDGLDVVSAGFLQGLNQRYDDAFYSIATYDSGRWKIIGSRDGKPYGVENFQIAPGRGYLLKSKRNMSLYLSGIEVVEPVPIAFAEGWNLVGVHSSGTSFTGGELLSSVNEGNLKADNITRWDDSKGRYDGLQQSANAEGKLETYGFDYPLLDKSAYFVRIVSGEGRWTPE